MMFTLDALCPQTYLWVLHILAKLQPLIAIHFTNRYESYNEGDPSAAHGGREGKGRPWTMLYNVDRARTFSR